MEPLNKLLTTKNAHPNKITTHLLLVSYTRLKKAYWLNPYKKKIKRVLPQNVTARSVYIGTKICSKFTRTKDQTLKEHQHDIVNYAECRERNCTKNWP